MTPLTDVAKPLLTIDGLEHAYYLDIKIADRLRQRID